MIYSENNDSKFQLLDYDSKTALIDIGEYMKKFSTLERLVFHGIVSNGISKEKDAKALLVETLIHAMHKVICKDSIWRAIKFLVDINMFKVIRINTGIRTFNVLKLTELGSMVYMMMFKKNPPEFEHERILRDHASLQHGCTVEDVAAVLNEKGWYDRIITERVKNRIKFSDGKECIPDVVGIRGTDYDYYEVECGTHHQPDFDEKCNKLMRITKNIIIVTQSRKIATQTLKPQAEYWIRRRGRENLLRDGYRLFLTSISDLQAGKWTYVFDMLYDEPICCFRATRKEGNENA